MSDDHDHEMMVESIIAARDDLTPDNPPPDPKWQAKQGLHRLRLNGSEAAVLWCLIDHASAAAGTCYPSEPRIGRLLDLPLRTVERAIASLERRGLIDVVRRFNARGATSNLYLIHWCPLFDAYRAMKAASKVAGTPRQKWREPPVKSGGQTYEGGTKEREPRT